LVHNLTIGLVGPYGAGCSSLAEELTRSISDFPGCLVETIHVASLIQQDGPRLLSDKTTIPESDFEKTTSPKSDRERRKSLQNAGTALRKIDLKLVGNAIVAEIFSRGRELETAGVMEGGKLLVFIVDSVKNIHDVKVLRQIYGTEFYLVSVNAPHDDRWLRMKQYKSWSEQERVYFEECDKIDSDEKTYDMSVGDAGQQVSKVAATADYHIANNKNRQQLAKDAARLINLLFGFGTTQPTMHERSMHLALSAARRSYCLSKQVGAAIVDQQGNILGIGHNDVPKAGGGLYTTESIDKRCYQTGNSRCINDTNKQERFENLQRQILQNFDITDKEKLRRIISTSEFRESTEYCRAVHAEMEALLSISRSQGCSAVGATMYVTTYPCHNCTKHILCAGIKKVYYIEPYPKSLAEELNSDAINFYGRGIEGCSDKLQFLPYEGVAPHTYDDFFSMKEERKDKNGKLIQKTRLQAIESPLFARYLDKRSRGASSFNPTTIAEQQIFNSYIEMIQEGEEGRDGGAVN